MRFVFRIHKPRNVSTKRGCARSFGCESRCKPRRWWSRLMQTKEKIGHGWKSVPEKR